MKRITFIMAAIICLAISAMAQQTQPQQLNADQPLAPALWKQGIATCAHFTACDRRFGKKIEEIKSQFPQGYTLDNLNEVYGGQGRKWEKIYNEFKKEENRGGSINDLKELVSPQIWKLVEPEFQAYITEHPEMANAVPETNPQDGGNNDAVNEGENENGNEGATGPAVAKKDNGMTCSANLPLWLGILGSLLGLCALLTALSNRGKIKEMQRSFAREIERTNVNLQEFSTDAANQMKALSIRLTGKTGIPGIEADPITEEAPQIEEEEVPADGNEEGEVLNLFTSKPDDNDDFTRVSDSFEPGNSIYVLTTFDGKHGQFEVIAKPEVHSFALMMPAESLMRA